LKRIHELDALRGIALFGILLVNIFVFHAPYSYYGEFYGAFEGIQKTTVDLVVEFAGGKFLFLFAFLFGYGIVLQMKSHADSFLPYFTKRMLVLFGFGTLHILLFWFGDILASYAVLGLILIPTLQLPDRVFLWLGLFFIFFRPLYYFGAVAFDWPLLGGDQQVELNEFISTFQNGSYIDIFQLRMSEFWGFMPENLVWYIPKTFGLFFIGMFAAKKDLFASIKKNPLKYTIISLLLIVASAIWIDHKMDVFTAFDLELQPIWRPLLIAINVTFETTLGFGYIFGFILIFQNVQWLTQLLAKTGRMALTNYIIQSLICVFIFYGYGFGYYGQLNPTDLVIIAIVIFAFSIIFSTFWLKNRNMGPLEHLWRKLIREIN